MANAFTGDDYLANLKKAGADIDLILSPPEVKVPLIDRSLRPLVKVYTFHIFPQVSEGFLFQDLVAGVKNEEGMLALIKKWSGFCLHVQLLTALFVNGEEDLVEAFTWRKFLKLDSNPYFLSFPAFHRMVIACLDGASANTIRPAVPVVQTGKPEKKKRLLFPFWKRSPS